MVIGAGTAGTWAARTAAGLGARTALVEREAFTVLRGRGRLTGPHEVEVDGRQVTAERLVIASGSSPARPPIEACQSEVT
jgi:glutathione reductase (NADPH)